MFVIKSYLHIPNKKITNLDEVTNDPDSFFIDISNREGVMQIAAQIDFDFLDGAIYMKYGEQVILDFALWDLVDQLWSYFLNMIADFITNNEAEIYFPDQPVKLRFENLSEDAIVFNIEIPSSPPSKWTLPKHEFLNSLLEGAKYFFDKMDEYFPNNEYYTDELKRIEDLKSIFNSK